MEETSDNKFVKINKVYKGGVGVMKDKFKFDVVIGNPPYQEETQGKKTKNGQKRVKSIFQLFQEQAELVAKDMTSLIYPGGRWIHQSGKGMTSFGLRQINDNHLKKLIYYPNSNEVFDKVGIADGISIVVKDMNKEEKGFTYEYIRGGTKLS